jgi:hypothetical protein
MDKIPNTSGNPNSETKQTTQTWWKRSMWGEGSIIDKLRSGGKSPVPDDQINLYNRERMDSHFFAKTAEGVDNDKFINTEFLLFVKIKYCLKHELEEYEELENSTKLLQAAIEASHSYLTLDQTELRYRSSKQQEFYQFVVKLLNNTEDQEKFKTQIQEKLTEILPSIKTEEGKAALQAYITELNKLSEYELGLKLLALFKTYHLADYSILRTIADMVEQLSKKENSDLKTIVVMVVNKYEVFDKIREIIGVSEKRSNPETYARMLQYIVLNYKHKVTYIKFHDLIRVLRKWLKPYQAMLKIRRKYSSDQYRQPKDFTEPIVGESIYEKYKKLLTDSKTGRIYIDLSEETVSQKA